MTRTIILDLDGPILDVKRRNYACYSQILREKKYVPLEIKDYWQMKRRAVGWPRILAATHSVSIRALFERNWKRLIESREFLALDQVQSGCVKKLEEWKRQEIQLILVTMRISTERLEDQLAGLGLRNYFNQLVLAGNGSRRYVSSKAKMVEPFINNRKEDILWIGDTEEDIRAARKIGCSVCAVTCGIRTRVALAVHRPDWIRPDLKAIQI